MQVMHFLKLTTDQCIFSIGWRAQAMSLTSGKKDGGHLKAKFTPKLTPGMLVTFLPDNIFLPQLSLESPRYIAYIISTIFVMLIGYNI